VPEASAPDFAPRKLWDSGTDDGQELTNLNISDDGKYVVYVRGGSHDANWMERPWPDPDLRTDWTVSVGKRVSRKPLCYGLFSNATEWPGPV